MSRDFKMERESRIGGRVMQQQLCVFQGLAKLWVVQAGPTILHSKYHLASLVPPSRLSSDLPYLVVKRPSNSAGVTGPFCKKADL